MLKKLLVIFLLLILMTASGQIANAEEKYLLSFDSSSLSSNTSINNASDNSDDLFFVLDNDKFIVRNSNKLNLFDNTDPIIKEQPRLLRLEITQTENLYDEIKLAADDLPFSNLGDLNYELAKIDPCSTVVPMIYKEKPVSPFVNRLKTVYFLTSLSTYIGQSTQIQDAFTKGHSLTGGGTSKSDEYGYNNIARNLLNPVSRAIKGAKVDDSGPTVNYFQHPMFGFGISSYLTCSGASTKEALLVALADNFIFEYVVEGSYVAPSGIDFLTTSGGIVAGYLASKYIFKKPFKYFLSKTSALKKKFNVEFDPIIEPGYVGKGMRVGSTITFKH